MRTSVVAGVRRLRAHRENATQATTGGETDGLERRVALSPPRVADEGRQIQHEVGPLRRTRRKPSLGQRVSGGVSRVRH